MRRRWLTTLTLATGLQCSGCTPPAEAPPLLGYVEADWAYVAAPASGWILEQPVARGSRVAKGDLLFALDDTKQRAQVDESSARVLQAKATADDLTTGARAPELRALEARVAEALAQRQRTRAERDRIVSLVDQGVEPAAARDRVVANDAAAKAALQAARDKVEVAQQSGRPAARSAAVASLNAARAANTAAEYQLNERVVRSRTAGIVQDCLYQPGEFVPSGTAVIALLPDDGLHVRFFVSQEQRPAFAVGQPVRVSADGLDTPVTAKISFVASVVEFTPPIIYAQNTRQKLKFEVEARLPPNSRLAPGLPVEIRR